MLSQYKKKKDLESRKKEAERMRSRFPDRIPVICERAEKSNVPELDKCKFLVPSDLDAFQFSQLIRDRIKLSKDQAIWLFVNGKYALKANSVMAEIYEQKKDVDGFLYITYSGDNTYGSNSQ